MSVTQLDPRLVQFQVVPRLVELFAHLNSADRVSVLREFGAWMVIELAAVLDEEPHSAGLLVAALEAGLKVIAADVEFRRCVGGAVEMPLSEDAH